MGLLDELRKGREEAPGSLFVLVVPAIVLIALFLWGFLGWLGEPGHSEKFASFLEVALLFIAAALILVPVWALLASLGMFLYYLLSPTGRRFRQHEKRKREERASEDGAPGPEGRV